MQFRRDYIQESYLRPKPFPNEQRNTKSPANARKLKTKLYQSEPAVQNVKSNQGSQIKQPYYKRESKIKAKNRAARKETSVKPVKSPNTSSRHSAA